MPISPIWWWKQCEHYNMICVKHNLFSTHLSENAIKDSCPSGRNSQEWFGDFSTFFLKNYVFPCNMHYVSWPVLVVWKPKGCRILKWYKSKGLPRAGLHTILTGLWSLHAGVAWASYYVWNQKAFHFHSLNPSVVQVPFNHAGQMFFWTQLALWWQVVHQDLWKVLYSICCILYQNILMVILTLFPWLQSSFGNLCVDQTGMNWISAACLKSV